MISLTATPLHENVPVRVAAAAVGPDGRLTPPHLIRLLQEAAMQNTLRLKISSPELMERSGLSWILRRQRITVSRWPKLGETGSILTAPTGFARGLLTYRDFHLLDAGGQPLATASSEWLLMNVGSRRLQPIPPDIASLSAQLAPATAHLDRPTGKVLPPDPEVATHREFTVAYYQLDFNNHLTNPVFPELMLEPLAADFRAAYEPTLIDLAFRQEARYGEALTAQAAPRNEERLAWRHALLRGEEVLATMATKWRKKR